MIKSQRSTSRSYGVSGHSTRNQVVRYTSKVNKENVISENRESEPWTKKNSNIPSGRSYVGTIYFIPDLCERPLAHQSTKTMSRALSPSTHSFRTTEPKTELRMAIRSPYNYSSGSTILVGVIGHRTEKDELNVASTTSPVYSAPEALERSHPVLSVNVSSNVHNHSTREAYRSTSYAIQTTQKRSHRTSLHARWIHPACAYRRISFLEHIDTSFLLRIYHTAWMHICTACQS